MAARPLHLFEAGVVTETRFAGMAAAPGALSEHFVTRLGPEKHVRVPFNPRDRWVTAAVVTAIGAFTDLRLVPPRLSPGFEHRLSKTGVALVYLGFACGLALAAQGSGSASIDDPR